jgi:RNA-binding protein YhbY
MKVIAKPIEILVWLGNDGVPHPVKFKITNKDETESTIKINRVLKTNEERLAGNRMIIYDCMGVVGEKEREFEIKFELSTCKWILFKI